MRTKKDFAVIINSEDEFLAYAFSKFGEAYKYYKDNTWSDSETILLYEGEIVCHFKGEDFTGESVVIVRE